VLRDALSFLSSEINCPIIISFDNRHKGTFKHVLIIGMLYLLQHTRNWSMVY
jgi:hypothetical protein